MNRTIIRILELALARCRDRERAKLRARTSPGLNDAQVKAILRRHARGNVTLCQLADMFGADFAQVHEIIRAKERRNYGRHWTVGPV